MYFFFKSFLNTDERFEGIWFWFKAEIGNAEGNLKSSCVTRCMSPQQKLTTIKSRSQPSHIFQSSLSYHWSKAKCHGKVYPSYMYRIACQNVKTLAIGHTCVSVLSLTFSSLLKIFVVSLSSNFKYSFFSY